MLNALVTIIIVSLTFIFMWFVIMSIPFVFLGCMIVFGLIILFIWIMDFFDSMCRWFKSLFKRRKK